MELAPPEKKGGQRYPFATYVAREGIKADNRLRDIVTASVRNYEEITELKTAIMEQKAAIHDRGMLGMAIRRWDSPAAGNHWKLQVLYALLVEVMQSHSTQGMSAGAPG